MNKVSNWLRCKISSRIKVDWFISVLFDSLNPVSIQYKEVNGKALYYNSYKDMLASIK